MECAALRSPLVRQSRRTSSEFGFWKRRVRPLCHLKVRQQTWQCSKFRSRRWFADVGIAERFPRLSLDSPHLQASYVSLDRWPVGISAGQYGPCHARQFVGQRHADDVVVATR